MRRIVKVTALAASLCAVVLAGGAKAQSADPNDTARFLAGMQPSAGSPLAPLTQDHAWQQHARRFDSIFGSVDSRQLKNIRAWSSAKLTSPSPVLFYMFSGPDFLYANAFFPQASTYVMSGLEPTGPIPDLTKLPRGSISSAFQNIEGSLRSIVSYSFFQTKDMRSSLVATRVSGTIPILYVFLARSGKTIRDVSLISLDKDGTVQPASGTGVLRDGRGGSTHGVKIVFAGSDGREKMLYYFSTNVANDGFKASGFAAFCERLGPGDAFVKSASYLMHEGYFSDVRKFLLARSRLVLQDDSGIPVNYFESGSWQLRPFGHYSGPIGIFGGKYQPKLTHLFGGRVESIDFGVGYHWRPRASNLMIAARTAAIAPDTVASDPPDAGKTGAQTSDQTPSTPSILAEPPAQERKPAARNRSTTNKPARTQRAQHYSSYPAPWFPWYGGHR